MVMIMTAMLERVTSHNYKDALTKSILFFEGQRSGKLPSSQRLTWRKDSGLRDGFEIGVDLVGGYYDAGDNVKYNFPMAFTTTMLAWSVLEFKKGMDTDLPHALDSIRWATDYLLKSTSIPGLVFAQVGDPHADHHCWERPEDMDTPRTPYAVSKTFPGSEVSAEIAAALAASSMVFRADNNKERDYSAKLLKRAKMAFDFADKNRGSYNYSLGQWVCPFYCDFSGYHDELVWAAIWLFKATKEPMYWNYVKQNVHNLDNNFGEFGWDSKHAGINVLVSKMLMSSSPSSPFVTNADKFVCSVLPESPTRSVSYSSGGLLFKPGSSNLQHATTLSFLLLVYAKTLHRSSRTIHCNNVVANPSRLVEIAKNQVDYILGSNPMKMSYMVGYGNKFPMKIHHRGSSLPSMDHHPELIDCNSGKLYAESNNPNPNLLIGAVVGGPNFNDSYSDSRFNFEHSEPTLYINAPFVGVLAFFKSPPKLALWALGTP